MPLTLKIKADNFKFDAKKFTEAFKKKALVQTRQGMRVFLRTILDADLPPVLSGEARGSLKPLGRFLRVAVPISVKRGSKNRIAKGEAQGIEPVVKTLRLGISVRFGTKVEHYIRNDIISETGNFQKPRPWNSFELGTKAFDEFILKNLNKLQPALKSFLKISKGKN